MNHGMSMVEIWQYYDASWYVYNAAMILTQQIPIDVRINMISMHCCVSITTVLCPMHERFENILWK